MKSTLKMLIAVAATGICAGRSEAITDYYRIHGNSCHSATQGIAGEISQHGLGNPSSTIPLTVACPIVVPEEMYTQGYLAFAGFDRHGTENISCTLAFTAADGEILKTAVTNTTGSANHSIRYGDGVRVYPTSAQRIPYLSCRIPATYSSGWMSVLTSVYIGLSY